MQALTGAPSHILLNRKDNSASHSTRPAKTGPASAFAATTFGPMDMPDKAGGASSSSAAKKAVTGGNALTGGNVAWLTQLSVANHVK